MKIIKLLGLLFFITCFSCTQTSKESCSFENEEHFFSEMTKLGEIVKIDSIFKDINYLSLPDSCVTYVSKSDCSVCINCCINFLSKYNLKNNSKIAVIISENDSAVVDYYFSNVPKIANRFHLLCNANYIANNLNNYNGLIIWKQGNNYETYKYIVKY